MKNEYKKPLFTFKRSYYGVLAAGIILVFIFFIIYILLAIKTKQVSFYSLLYHNLKNYLFLTILSGFYVGVLGFGILFILIAFFNLTLKIKTFADRFLISVYLQKKKTLPFSKIDRVSVKIFYLNYDNLFKKYEKKECRVFIHNSIHSFYFCYPVEGYFDDVEINLKKAKENMDERCCADKASVTEILKILKKNYNITIPYLPKESNEAENDNHKRIKNK
jgi:hypothetical protein